MCLFFFTARVSDHYGNLKVSQLGQRRSCGSAARSVPPVCGLQGSLQPALLSHVLRSLSAGVCEAFPPIKLREVTGSWKGSPAATGGGG